jgi:hypothetical protein
MRFMQNGPQFLFSALSFVIRKGDKALEPAPTMVLCSIFCATQTHELLATE